MALAVFSLAAYAFAVLRFPGRHVLYVLFLAMLFVPSVTTLLPLVILEVKLGLIDSRLGLILPFANSVAPYAVLLLTITFRAIPTLLRDAAKIDGASERQIFFHVYLPLARPALVTVAILTFVGLWNEYVFTSVALTTPSNFTLPMGLQALLSQNVVQQNQVMAGALILVVPVIVMFVLLQRYFINGLAGGVKG